MNSPAAYIALLPALTEAALQCGYAIGVRGAIAPSMELIAAPWAEEASDGQTLLIAMAESIGLEMDCLSGPTLMPLGRTTHVINVTPGVQICVNVAPRHIHVFLHGRGEPAAT